MNTDIFSDKAYIIDDSPDDRRRLSDVMIQYKYTPNTWDDGSIFLNELDQLPPGYVFLDVRMPGIDGLSIAKKLFGYRATFPVIMVSGHSDIPTAVTAMKNGAYDFIEKPWRAEDILSSMQYVGTFVNDQQKNNVSKPDKVQILNKITPRETQVLRLLINGAQNKYIAFNLGIAERTVEMHRSRLMKRLEVKSFAELIRLAVKAGIGDEDEV